MRARSCTLRRAVVVEQEAASHEVCSLRECLLHRTPESRPTASKRATPMARLSVVLRSNKLLVMFCINVANLCCHAVYSVLAAFFPQEAKAKGMSDDGVGIIFASFAAVIFVCSPCAGRLMSSRGKVIVYLWGLLIVSSSTICFSAASAMPAGWPFYTFCLVMRVLQGVGAAMEETAAYAIIADIEPDRVSFFLGICEISTGVGYMVNRGNGGKWVGGGWSPKRVCARRIRRQAVTLTGPR